MSFILGVDPGKTGALTLISPDRLTASIFDMPVIPIGNGKRTEVNGPALYNILDHFKPDHAFIEDVWSLQNDGHVGAFSFGDALGTIKGVIWAYCDLSRVRPQVWKKTMRVTADKDTSIARAKELHPCLTHMLTRKKDDGRAESALIATYGLFSLGIRLPSPLTYWDPNNDESTSQ